ncbi:MAG: nucleoside-triphosphatase [Candidatus Odinarchaeia archaeon]
MKNILITGPPKCGKTTLIKKLVNELDLKATGFITEEVLENNTRVGFSIRTLSGTVKPLASKKNRSSTFRVGSYGVYLNNIDAVIREILEELEKNNFNVVIIDEIGKMELFSDNFRKFVLDALDNFNVLGTIMLRDNEFTRKIKLREDCCIYNISVVGFQRAYYKIKSRLESII